MSRLGDTLREITLRDWMDLGYRVANIQPRDNKDIEIQQLHKSGQFSLHSMYSALLDVRILHINQTVWKFSSTSVLQNLIILCTYSSHDCRVSCGKRKKLCSRAYVRFSGQYDYPEIIQFFIILKNKLFFRFFSGPLILSGHGRFCKRRRTKSSLQMHVAPRR